MIVVLPVLVPLCTDWEDFPDCREEGQYGGVACRLYRRILGDKVSRKVYQVLSCCCNSFCHLYIKRLDSIQTVSICNTLGFLLTLHAVILVPKNV